LVVAPAMVKAYLRYQSQGVFGLIASNACNTAVTDDGKLVLSGANEQIAAWSLRKGTLEACYRAPTVQHQVTHIVCKPGDDNVVAAGYQDGCVRVWYRAENKMALALHGHKTAVTCLIYSKNTFLLASASMDTDIVVWDTVAESGLYRLRGHRDQVTAIAFLYNTTGSPDEAKDPRLLVSSSKDQMVKIWDLSIQSCVQSIVDHRSEVWSMCVNEQQTRLVCGSTDAHLRVWELSPDAKPLEEDDGNGQVLFAKSLGKLDRPVSRDNVISLQFAHVPRQQQSGKMRSSADLLVAQGSTSKRIEFWKVLTDQEIVKKQKRRKKRALEKAKKKGLDGGPEADEDGNKETEKDDKDASPALQASDEFQVLPGHVSAAKLRSSTWSLRTATLILGLNNNTVEVYKLTDIPSANVETESPLGQVATRIELPGHRNAIRALAVSQDDSMILSMDASSIKVWNSHTQRVVRTITSGYGLCGSFIAGGEHALIGTKEGELQLFDLGASAMTSSEQVHENSIYGLALHPDNTMFATASADKSVKFFKFEMKRLTMKDGTQTTKVTFRHIEGDLGTLQMHDDCLSAAYTPNGKLFAVTLLDFTVSLYHTDTNKFFVSLYGHKLPVLCCDFSSDSQILATGSADKSIKMWSVQFGNCLRSIRAHEDSVMQVKFLTDTHYLCTVSRDRLVKLWDCDTYEMITSLAGHTAEIWALAVSQDGAFLVSAGGDKGMRIWQRTGEQFFLDDQREKELEEQFEAEAARDDHAAIQGNVVLAQRPTRKTIEAVKNTEELIEVLDQAAEAQAHEDAYKKELAACEKMKTDGHKVHIPTPRAPDPSPLLMGRSPSAHVVRNVCTLKAENMFEVLLALPNGYAYQLLNWLLQYFEACQAAIGDDDGAGFLAASLEVPTRAALILVHINSRQFMSPTDRPMIMRLRKALRPLLQRQVDQMSFNLAAVEFLQRKMKSSRVRFGADLSAAAPQAKAKKTV